MDNSILRISAEFIVSNFFISFYCAAIVLWALYCYFLVLRKNMVMIIKEMKDNINNIREFPDLSAFYGRFREFDQWVCENKLMNHLWNEFKETLIMPLPASGNMIIRNTAEASCCFNEQSIISSKINLRFFNALPNYLTGFGILGTFVGLVAGIYLAGIGLASPNPDIMKAGLDDLLHGASLAFLTSICGLLASIVFSMREKAVSHALSSLVSDWNQELDRRIERITPERLAAEQLEELKKQTVFQEEFATKVAFNISEAIGTIMQERLVPGIADAFGQRMNEHLVPALDRLVNEVEALRKERGDTNENMLQQVVDQFSQTMSGAAGQEMTALSGTLKDLRDTLAPLMVSMHEANSTMRDNAAVIAHGIKDSFAMSSQTFNEGISKAMADLQTAVSAAGDSFNSSLQQELSPLVRDLKQSQQDMHNSVTRLADRFEQAANQSSHSFAEGAGKAIAQLHEGIAAAGTVLHGDLKDAFGHAVDRLDQATVGLDNVLSSIRNAGGGIKDVVADTDALLQRFSAAAKHFTDIESRLAGSIQSLERTAQSIQAGGDATRSVMTQAQGGLVALQGAVEQFRTMHGAVRETLEHYAVHLKGLDDDLEKVFSKMHEGQMAYAQATNNYMAELDRQAGVVTGKFSGAVIELGGNLEDLAESVPLFVEAVQKLVDAMNRARSAR